MQKLPAFSHKPQQDMLPYRDSLWMKSMSVPTSIIPILFLLRNDLLAEMLTFYYIQSYDSNVLFPPPKKASIPSPQQAMLMNFVLFVKNKPTKWMQS